MKADLVIKLQWMKVYFRTVVDKFHCAKKTWIISEKKELKFIERKKKLTISETFTNAPSSDLKPYVLEIFVLLMRAQARECIFKRHQMENSNDFETLLAESHCLMREYAKIHYDIQCNGIHLPPCWSALIPLKTEYFKSLSHVYFAKNLSKKMTADEKNRFKIIKAHLQASQASHEEILRIQRMSRELRVSKFFFYFLHSFFYFTHA